MSIQHGGAAGAFTPVIVVVARIARHTAFIHFQRYIGQTVEQKTVVGNQKECPGITFQETAKPLHGRNIQIVGGFVQQQRIGLGDQHPCQSCTHPPAAGKTLQRLFKISSFEAKPAQCSFSFAFEPIAAQMFKGALQFTVAAQEFFVGIVRIFSQSMFDFFKFGCSLPQFGHGIAGIFHQQRIQRRCFQVLPQTSDTQIFGIIHTSGIRFQLSGDDGKKRGFTRAVGTDHPYPVA